MRVTVKIKDDRPGSGPVPEGGPPAVAPPPVASPAGTPAAGGGTGPEAGGGPSPELAARAARLGAISAGPAPSGAPDGSLIHGPPETVWAVAACAGWHG